MPFDMNDWVEVSNLTDNEAVAQAVSDASAAQSAATAAEAKAGEAKAAAEGVDAKASAAQTAAAEAKDDAASALSKANEAAGVAQDAIDAAQEAYDAIPTDVSELNNDAGYTTMGAVEGKGYQNASQVSAAASSAASTAKSEAISAASADATAKASAVLAVANEAASVAQDAIDAAQEAYDAIPTNVSQLDNDAGYQNASQVSAAASSAASTAKSEAISAAAADATSKANAAQSAATSAAASDATSKANAAAKTATDYLDYADGTLTVGKDGGGSVVITETGFSIYDSQGRETSKFGANSIEIGRYAPDTATIKLLGNRGQLKVTKGVKNRFDLFAENVGISTGMGFGSADGGSVDSKAYVQADCEHTSSDAHSSVSIRAEHDDNGAVDAAGINVSDGAVELYAVGDGTLNRHEVSLSANEGLKVDGHGVADWGEHQYLYRDGTGNYGIRYKVNEATHEGKMWVNYCTFTTTSWTTTNALPEKYRPASADGSIGGAMNDWNSAYPGTFVINTNGTVTLHTTSARSTGKWYGYTEWTW